MSRERTLDFLIAAVFAALLALSATTKLGPSGRLNLAETTLGDTCTFHRLTTVNCPFCGLARSMVALFDGRVRDSLRFHPLGVFLAAAFVLTVAAVGVSAMHRSQPVIETRLFSAVMLALIVASLCLWTVNGLRRACSQTFTVTRVVE